MISAMEIVLALAGGVVLVVVCIILQRRATRRTATLLEAVAVELGGRRDGRVLRSTIGEMELTVDEIVDGGTGEASQSRRFVQYSVSFAPWSPPVRMRAQGLGAKLDGERDVVIGQPDFDGVVHIATDAPSAVRDALGPERRRLILALLDNRSHPNEVSDSSLTFHVPGMLPRDPAVIVAKARELIDVAERLADAPPQSHRPPRRD